MTTEWAFERIREAFEKVAEDEAGKLIIRTKNCFEEFRLLAAHHCASRRARRCYDVVSVPNLQQFFPWKTTCGWFQLGRGARICGETNDFRTPNRLQVVQSGDSASRPSFSKRMRYRKVCVRTWSMRSNCWPTSRKMETVQSRALWQDFVRKAG